MHHSVIKNNNEVKKIKASYRLSSSSLLKFGLSLVLMNYLIIQPAFAKDQVELKNIYLTDFGSLVIETKDKRQIENFELLKAGTDKYKLLIKNANIEKGFLKDFNKTHSNFKLSKYIEKNSFFDKDRHIEMQIECAFDCEARFEPVLGGLAYSVSFSKKDEQIKVAPNSVQATLSTKTTSSAIDMKIDDELLASPALEAAKTQVPKITHMLKANKKENFLFALTKEDSPVEEFINQLDENISTQILNKENFQKENLSKADSASLNYIADELADLGRNDLAAEAYFKALKTNPENLNAMLGLARNSKDKNEKLKYYLKAIDEEALLSIGKTWFEEGLASGDIRKIEQGIIGYQFAVLKNPANPYYRFSFAQALERSGYQNFEQASKRYLEAAVLAKKDYKSGDNSKEDIMRRSTECLIKVLTKKGSQDQAVHYCNSYIGLGYKKFLDGRSIRGIMKELNSNKNPFS